MPDRPTALTASAGEHYVAYVLSSLGVVAALTRGGSPAVDLMVGNPEAGRGAMIQVKTSNWARRERRRNPDDSHWEWDVGKRAIHLRGDNIFYAFVDLRWQTEKKCSLGPEVFIVPSSVVADALGPGWSRNMFWIMEPDKGKYFSRWDRIADYLGCQPEKQ